MMIYVRDEYLQRFGRQTLSLWSGPFASVPEGEAWELPRHDGFMVTLDHGQKIRVTCDSPRTEDNWEKVDYEIRRAIMLASTYTIWVCQCCMLTEANGECCTEYALLHSDGTPCFDRLCGAYWTDHIAVVDGTAPLLHGGDGREPLSSISPDDVVSLGMGWEEHAEDCETRKTHGNPPSNYECECETRSFSTSQCKGCGSYLAGERHAMTVFPGERNLS